MQKKESQFSTESADEVITLLVLAFISLVISGTMGSLTALESAWLILALGGQLIAIVALLIL